MGAATWFEKRVLNGIRKRFAKLASYPSVVEHDGATFILDPANWIDNRLIAGIPYETAQLKHAAGLVADHGVDMFIDIGANIGLYSILIGRLDQVREVLAIEPMSRNYNQLLANVFANRLDSKVTARRCAIADEAGTATLFIDPRSTGLSRLDLTHLARDPNVFRLREEVEVVCFDEEWQISGRRPFVKIDVEGHACKVLGTMTDFLANNEAILQIELFDLEHDQAAALLASCGYAETAQIGGDYYFSRKA